MCNTNLLLFSLFSFLTWGSLCSFLFYRFELGIHGLLVSPLIMKSGPKNAWRSIMPLCLRGKSATRFCLFPKVKSAGYSPGNAPVYLNVYDLTTMNGYVYWAGLGIFHSGVEG
jgi:hypothetical protein